MNKFVSILSAAAIALPMLTIAPAISAPIKLRAPMVEHNIGTPVIDIQYRRKKNHYRPSHKQRHNHRQYRRGSRNGNLAVGIIGGLAAGAIIGSMTNSRANAVPPRNYHVEWCLDRYRSYDVRSDTFQPYNGPRQYCNSPYR